MSQQRSKRKKKKKRAKIKEIKGSVNIPSTRMDELEMSGTPLFLEYVIMVGSMMKYFGMFMIILFVFVIVMLALSVLFGDGWKEFGRFFVEFFTFWNFTYIIQFSLIFLPFVCWWYFSERIMKNRKGKRFFMYEDKVVFEKGNGRKTELSYPALQECIRKKKIRIGPDWVDIPCERGRFRVYDQEKDQVVRLFRLLKEHCDFSYPEEELQETLREYLLGWSISYLIGIPCMLFGCWVSVIGWMSEGVWNLWEIFFMLFTTKNVVGVVGVIIILVGYMLKIIYGDATRKYFKLYKEFIRVC